MQRAALHAREIQGDYTVLDVTPAELPGLLRRLRAGELAGCNVTVPYKTALAAACDRLEGDASLCQAVNTLLMRDGELIGENTDARGFELALGYQRLRPEPGGRALVLGAGGAASACVLALCRMRVDEVVVVARRLEQAEELCLPGRAGDRPAARLATTPRAARAACEAGIVVNAASVGVAAAPIAAGGAAPPSASSSTSATGPGRSTWWPRPASAGCAPTDGAEMLLFQGMLSFQLWTGVDPPWHAARAALEEALAA